MSRPPQHLFPFASHYLETRGLRMHYLDEGPRDAPPVLMLHGNPTWSFYYRNLVKALSQTHRCIVPDHIGCGLSDKPGDEKYDYRLASRIEDVDTLIEHLGLCRPLNLVVHDWGGMIGFAWAVKNPERISKLVVLNTAAFPLPEEKRMPPALSLVRDGQILWRTRVVVGRPSRPTPMPCISSTSPRLTRWWMTPTTKAVGRQVGSTWLSTMFIPRQRW